MQKESSYQLSIITINYNNALGLEKTMQSVNNQTWNAFEHIIVDGNSTDDSLEVIKSFNYNNLKYSSEPDLGIYNAMNKGIEKATGKYLLFFIKLSISKKVSLTFINSLSSKSHQLISFNCLI